MFHFANLEIERIKKIEAETSIIVFFFYFWPQKRFFPISSRSNFFRLLCVDNK